MATQVLVTGGNGQLAQTIKALYFKNKHDLQFTFVSKKTLDITNFEAIESFFSIRNFDYCVNCAAYTNVEQAEESTNLAFNINAEAVNHISNVCKQRKVILIHISTDYVFDGQNTSPYKETDEVGPINTYGESKLKGEQYIIENIKEYYIIRTSWLYSKFGKNFFKTILNKIKENANLKITTAETGTPTSCVDLATVIYTIINTKENAFGLYHFSNKGQATWFDFAKEIAILQGNYDVSNITPVDFFKTKAKRPKYSVLNKQKINAILSQENNHWKTALKELIKTI